MTDSTRPRNISEVAGLIRRLAVDVKVSNDDLIMASTFLISKLDASVDRPVVLDQNAKIETSREHELYLS